MDNIQKSILDSVETVLNKKLRLVKQNFYLDGKVIAKANNKYTVQSGASTYTNIPARTGMSFSVGDQVQMIVKNGDTSRKFIDDYKLI